MSLQINPVLCRAGVMDNYAYVIVDEQTGTGAVVDASEAEPVIKKCQELQLHPQYIFTTHHHFDHVGGNKILKEKYGLKIIGPQAEKELIDGLDIGIKDGDEFLFGASPVKVISAAGHTRGHVLWYFSDDKTLFTGDVLFNLCIGGIFEGTSAQMWDSLQKIKALPDETLFYPGHEYTQHGLTDAVRHNGAETMAAYVQRMQTRFAQNLPVAPVTLGLEKQCNPYLQINDKKIFEQCF